MRSLRLALVAAVAIGASALRADAQAIRYATSAKTFVAVDSVSVQEISVVVTGVVQGEATASTWGVYAEASSDRIGWAGLCQRNALLAMSMPGRYLLTILQGGTYSSSTCTLTRVNP